MSSDVPDDDTDDVRIDQNSSGRWLSVLESARVLKITERSVRRRIASGSLRTRRDGRRTLIWVDSDESGRVRDDDTDTSVTRGGESRDAPDASADAVRELARLLERERERASQAEQTSAMYQERNRNLEAEVQRLSAQLALPAPSPEPASPPDPVEALREEVGQLRARLEAPRSSWWAFWRRG